LAVKSLSRDLAAQNLEHY